MSEKKTEENTNSEILLEFQNVSIKTASKNILQNISGFVKPGTILTLMGPSGAGKSSLLNFLSGHKGLLGKGVETSGHIFLNGKLFTLNDKRLIGYVMQDDIFIASLTLRETIYFYAKVRLPDTYTKKEKFKIADDTIEILELTRNMETYIGGPLIRGLSGGERKRANIAVELITNPSIIFLDEPTSGLDSSMAFKVVEILQKLSHYQKKTIIASIHQPNSQTFNSFDYLMLLSFGQPFYFGPVKNLGGFFTSANYPCPRGWNIADYMIDMARQTDDIRAKIIQHCQDNCQIYIEDYSNMKNICTIPKEEQISKAGNHTKKGKKIKWSVSFGSQLEALSRRSFIKSVTETFTLLNLVEAILIGIIMGIVWFRTPFDDIHYTSITGLLFYMATTAFIQPMFTNLFAFSVESPVLIREMMSKMYRLLPYYLSKTISELPVLFYRPFAIIVIAYWMSGLYPSVYFIPFILVCLFSSFMGQTIGLLFSSFGFTFKETQIITSFYFTFTLLLGGFFVRNIPVWLSWVRYISPIYHMYVILYHIQFKSSNGVECSQVVDSELASPFFDICTKNVTRVTYSDVVNFENFPVPFYANIIILLGIFFIARVATYFFLKKSLKRPPISTGIKFNFFAHKNTKSDKSKKNKKSKKAEHKISE